jgi:hypothetical protein
MSGISAPTYTARPKYCKLFSHFLGNLTFIAWDAYAFLCFKNGCSLREIFYVTRSKHILNSLSEEANGGISLHLRRRAAIKLTTDKE